jgi:putative MATE family efflux protein
MPNGPKNHILGDDNIGALLWRLAIPATVGMAVMATYGLVDIIFIGHAVGPLGIGGIALVFPVQMLVMAIGHMIGMGGASIISRALGADNTTRAQKTLGNVVSLIVLISAVLVFAGFMFADDLLHLLGATEKLFPYARAYLLIILWGIPFRAFAMGSNNIIRSEGRAKVAMTTMVLSAGINIILDAVFILGLGMGVGGAAIATVIATGCASVFVLIYFTAGFSGLSLRFGSLSLDLAIVRETIAVGFASFARMVSASVVMIILNHSLGFYGGDMAIAAYGIINRVVHFMFMPIMGFAQALQPVAGFNYGAGRFAKTKEAFRLSVVRATVFAIVAASLIMIFARPILGAFSGDAALLAMSTPALRIIIAAFPLVGFQMMGAALLQAHGRALPAVALSLARQVILLIPLVLILPRFIGLTGIFVSFPSASIGATTLALVLLAAEMRFLSEHKQDEAPA